MFEGKICLDREDLEKVVQWEDLRDGPNDNRPRVTVYFQDDFCKKCNHRKGKGRTLIFEREVKYFDEWREKKEEGND